MENVTETQTPKPRKRWAVVLLVAPLFLAAGAATWVFASRETAGKKAVAPAAPPAAVVEQRTVPEEVRGIYLTASTASSLSRYSEIIYSAKEKGVNAVVLDLKGADGSLAFRPKDPDLAREAPVKELITDFDKVVSVTREAGFYLIARFPVFQDPAYARQNPAIAMQVASGALWTDARGVAWLDPASERAWSYNAAIAEEAYARGFDEIQFDYVRFATDGSIGKIRYPVYDPKKEKMRETIGRFFAYLDKRLRPQGIAISADLFGFTTWHQNDLGIGQWYADALEHFDFVSAMVYPSHYPAGTLGFKNPAAHPYEIVLDSLKKGNEVGAQIRASGNNAPLAKARPWLQAFDLGAKYTPDMVMAQIRASRETAASGFLLWNAANRYAALPNLER